MMTSTGTPASWQLHDARVDSRTSQSAGKTYAGTPGTRYRFSPPDVLLAGALGVLFLPWAVRTISYWTGALEWIRVLHLIAISTTLLALYVGTLTARGELRVGFLMRRYRLWYGYLCIWGFWMGLWGYLHEPPFATFIEEICLTVIFVSAIAIGTRVRNWLVIDPVMQLGLAFVGIPVVVAGLVASWGGTAAEFTSGLVYTTSAILIPSTFYVIVADRFDSKWQRRFSSAAFLLYGICQFLFAKRAPLVRVLIVFLFAYWIVPGWLKKYRVTRRVVGIFLLSVMLATVTAAVSEQQWEAVAARFEKLGALFGATESSGFERLDNEKFRAEEVGYFYETMTPLQRIIGAGLGSYSQHPMLLSWFVDAQSDISGKSTTHIGMFFSFFKGGVVYFVVLHAGVIAALRRFRHIRHDALKLNAWVFVLICLIFSLAEGFFLNPGVELTTFLMGASIGTLISRQ